MLIQRIREKTLSFRKHLSYGKHKLDYPSLARASTVWEDVPAVNSLKYGSAYLATQWECEWAKLRLQKPPFGEPHAAPGSSLARPGSRQRESFWGSHGHRMGWGKQFHAGPWYSRTKAVIEPLFLVDLDGFIGWPEFIGRAFSDSSQFFLMERIA